MMEIIKRKEGEASQREQIDGNPQISYNDWGHIAIRAVQGDAQDVLVVLDRQTSERLIKFCKSINTVPGKAEEWEPF